MWHVVTSSGGVCCDQQCVVCGVTSRVRLGGRSTQGATVGATLDSGSIPTVPHSGARVGAIGGYVGVLGWLCGSLGGWWVSKQRATSSKTETARR